jgi:DNA-directed RNA polymerase subunit beta
MQSLGLDVKVQGEAGPEFSAREEDDDLLRAAEELGIDLSGGLGATADDAEAAEAAPEATGGEAGIAAASDAPDADATEG